MLEPDVRSLYTQALTPPPGWRFDAGLATTYSLDLTTLLTVPVNLALATRESSQEILEDSLSVLEAVRRTAASLVVYAQKGQIRLPSSRHPLFSLLEPVVVETEAPRGGAFHPKVWILRFVAEDDPKNVCLRALILSRNLTFDRSWDLSLMLEGKLTTKHVKTSEPLAGFISSLPRMSSSKVTKQIRSLTREIADQVSRTRWEVPKGYDSVKFHALGLRDGAWEPPSCDRMLVVSPFLTENALKQLARCSEKPPILISRSESMDFISKETLEKFQECWEIMDVDDPELEEEERKEIRLRGLHAKAYVCETDNRLHLFVGSANATGPAIRTGRNVEILAELVGMKSSTTSIRSVFESGGLMDLLQSYSHPADLPQQDSELLLAEQNLEKARRSLMDADLKIVIKVEGDQWQVLLHSDVTIRFPSLKKATVWPVTLPASGAADLTKMGQRKNIPLATCSMASLTSFIAFELVAEKDLARLHFVLNIQTEGMPEDRNGAVATNILKNRDGFIRYLLLLLSEMEDINLGPVFPNGGNGKKDGSGRGGLRLDELPLLEELTRAYCRDPEKVQAIARLIEDLKSSPEGKQVVPESFEVIWEAFKNALGKES